MAQKGSETINLEEFTLPAPRSLGEVGSIVEGFDRIERDDRLLDVFPEEISEKGIQLYEKWGDTEVEIIRVHDGKNMTKHVFNREEIEKALTENRQLFLM